MLVKVLNSAHGHIIPCSVVSENEVIATIKGGLLYAFATDPRLSEDPKERAKNQPLQSLFEIRREVQRLFTNQKQKNVDSYARYLIDVQLNNKDGEFPAIILWTEQKLQVEKLDDVLGYAQIPYSMLLVAIDGETQLAARFAARLMDNRMVDVPVCIKICHGRPVAWARQSFHDINMYGIKPNSAIALAMDMRDTLTTIAREVEENVPFFKGRIDKESRQLKKNGASIMTITNLRGGIVTLAKDISGVKYGSEHVEVEESKVAHIKTVAIEWFGALAQAFGPEMEDRVNSVTGTVPVIAALGAIGHNLLQFTDAQERQAHMKVLIDGLRAVKWKKGLSWVGIAGKFNASKKFSVGGAKENAYAVHRALTESTSPGYAQVRGLVNVQSHTA